MVELIIRLTLTDELAAAVEEAGLLEPERLASLLKSEVDRQQRVAHLRGHLAQVASRPSELTAEGIATMVAEEVAAYRAERRTDASESDQ